MHTKTFSCFCSAQYLNGHLHTFCMLSGTFVRNLTYLHVWGLHYWPEMQILYTFFYWRKHNTCLRTYVHRHTTINGLYISSVKKKLQCARGLNVLYCQYIICVVSAFTYSTCENLQTPSKVAPICAQFQTLQSCMTLLIFQVTCTLWVYIPYSILLHISLDH